jgi:hypothetical protein
VDLLYHERNWLVAYVFFGANGTPKGMPGDDETDLQPRQKPLQGELTKLNGLHKKLHANLS